MIPALQYGIALRGPVAWTLALLLFLLCWPVLWHAARRGLFVFSIYLGLAPIPFTWLYLLGLDWATDWRAWMVGGLHVAVGVEAGWGLMSRRERQHCLWIVGALAGAALAGLWRSGVGVLETMRWVGVYWWLTGGCVAGLVAAGFPAIYKALRWRRQDGWRIGHALVLMAWFAVSVWVNARYRWLQGEGYVEGWRDLSQVELAVHVACGLAWWRLLSNRPPAAADVPSKTRPS